MSWFRWYEGSCEDAKFRVVARNADVTVATVTGVWALLLEDASHKEHRGVATRGDAYHAVVLGLSDVELISIWNVMADADLITIKDNFIYINNWKKRQFESDETDATNADRQRRFRERKKAGTHNGNVTARNGDETAAKRPESESDTEADNTKGARYSTDFELFWKAYPRLEGNPKGPAYAEWQKALKAGEVPALLIAAAARYATASAKPDAPKVAHARTWLHQKRWNDWADAPGPPKAAVPMDHYTVSTLRLKNYMPGKPWPPTWGNKPEDGGTDLHPKALAEWKQRQGVAA